MLLRKERALSASPRRIIWHIMKFGIILKRVQENNEKERQIGLTAGLTDFAENEKNNYKCHARNLKSENTSSSPLKVARLN
jgi:hypothetical protein